MSFYIFDLAIISIAFCVAESNVANSFSSISLISSSTFFNDLKSFTAFSVARVLGETLIDTLPSTFFFSVVVGTATSALKVSGTLNVDDLVIEANDQSKIADTYIITNNLKLSAFDQAFINLQGTSISLVYKGENQSKGDLFTFETNDAQVYTSENATLNINSRKSLAGSVKGNSIVTYVGEPSKDTKISDNAQVVKK